MNYCHHLDANAIRISEFRIHLLLITKTTKKMQLCRLIYYSVPALHVSGDVFSHHQELLTVFTACGSIYQCRCRLVP